MQALIQFSVVALLLVSVYSFLKPTPEIKSGKVVVELDDGRRFAGYARIIPIKEEAFNVELQFDGFSYKTTKDRINIVEEY